MTNNNKYYVFYNPNEKKGEIVFSWEECVKKVKNVKNIKYKKFNSLGDAEQFLSQWQGQKIENKGQTTKKEKYIHIYVDGSFRQNKSKKAGWGWVGIYEDKKLAEDSGVSGANAISRNIDGEILATLKSLEWFQNFFQQKSHELFLKKIQNKVILCYDYTGIEHWATKYWRAKTPLTLYYQKNIQKYISQIVFQKIKSHSNNKWNDYVDLLAKKALEKN